MESFRIGNPCKCNKLETKLEAQLCDPIVNASNELLQSLKLSHSKWKFVINAICCFYILAVYRKIYLFGNCDFNSYFSVILKDKPSFAILVH